MSRAIRTAAATPELKPGNVAFNLTEIKNCIRYARECGVELLVFPELCLTGCSCGDLLMCDTITDAVQNASSELARLSDGIAFIDNISQDTHIAIDEKGVTASAFTEVQYAGAMIPEGRADMTLNRPFIFGIQHSGVLLFIGVCDNPAE